MRAPARNMLSVYHHVLTPAGRIVRVRYIRTSELGSSRTVERTFSVTFNVNVKARTNLFRRLDTVIPGGCCQDRRVAPHKVGRT